MKGRAAAEQAGPRCEPGEHDFLPPVVLPATMKWSRLFGPSWLKSATMAFTVCRKCGATIAQDAELVDKEEEFG